MNPIALIECIRITHDPDYAEEIAGKMVGAVYHWAHGAEKDSLMRTITAGFNVTRHESAMDSWSLEELIDFIDLYHAIFVHQANPNIRFVIMDSLLKKTAQLLRARAGNDFLNVPFWFRTMYLLPLHI